MVGGKNGDGNEERRRRRTVVGLGRGEVGSVVAMAPGMGGS